MPDVTIRDLTARLEQGVKDLFESDKYAAYLQTMSRFHNYSSRNILLIHMQYPSATKVASYLSWKNNFNRQVNKGEHGIKILAPISRGSETKEFEKIDPVTKQPVLDENGRPVMETLTSLGRVSFKTVNVFAYEQTTGEPLPELAETLTGDVERYELFMDALRAVSPLPIVFEDMPPDTDGTCYFGDRIAIRGGMSEIQTVAAVIHECAHAKLHDRALAADGGEPKSRRVEETEAESVAWVVASRYKIDTGANSFGYISSYARSRELKELTASLDTIRKASAELIAGIDKHYQALAKERGIDLSAVTDELGAEQNLNMIDGVINNEPPKAEETHPEAAPESPVAGQETSPEPSTAKPDILAGYARYAEIRDPRQMGLTILMPLLSEDGNLNRANKRSRVKVEPPIGKYEIFSRDVGTPPYRTNYLYLTSASGYLVQLDETERLKDLTEQKLDEHILAMSSRFEKQLADPTEWADFTAAALTGRVDEAEAHNVPVRKLREAESQARRDAAREHEKQAAAERQEIFDARVDEIAKAIERGEIVKVGYDARGNRGRNPVLELFRLYGVDLPLRTQGWVNTTLAAITPEGYSRYTKIGGKKRGESERFGERLAKLKQAVKRTPIEQKRGAPTAAKAPENTEVKDTLEHQLYGKFAAMFPEFMNGEYETLRLEAEHAKPLELEWVFGDAISIAHTYELNGEPAYEPRVMLTVNSEEKTLTAHSLELSKPPRMDDVYGSSGIADLERQRNINDFTLGWLDRAEKQRFRPVEATYRAHEQGKVSREGLTTDKAVKVTFDADGNMIMPEAEPDTAEPSEISKPNPMFPDPTVTPAERDAYGYTESDMHPLGRDKALELFDAGQTVYLLYPDNTEAMAFDRDEIITFTGDGGLCGVSHADWQFSGEFKTQAILSGFREDAPESDLLLGSESKFGIYQIPDYIKDYRDFRFASMRELEARGLTLGRDKYKLVYTAPLTIHDTQSNVNRIFNELQHDSPECPSDFTERSVSVSDVIVLQWRGEVSAHFVDSIGFKELPSFTGNEREQKPPETLSRIETNSKQKHAEPQKPAGKKSPDTLLGELAEAKDALARGNQPNVHKPNEREV